MPSAKHPNRVAGSMSGRSTTTTKQTNLEDFSVTNATTDSEASETIQSSLSLPWRTFVEHARPRAQFRERLLCLDPGITTGWALFDGLDLVDGGQWSTEYPADLANAIAALHSEAHLHRLLFEEYRIRGNKFKEHVGSEVPTIQNIGAIKVVADELGIPWAKQSAGMAKGFATDVKLRRWGLYQPNQRHFVDAIRHGCYWLLFTAGRSK